MCLFFCAQNQEKDGTREMVEAATQEVLLADTTTKNKALLDEIDRMIKDVNSFLKKTAKGGSGK